MVPFDDYRIEPRPIDADFNFGWTILRTPETSPVTLVCLSTDVFGIRTHYWRRRTTPCRKTDCPGCRDGRRSEWHGYVLCRLPGAGNNVVFEFTSAAVPSFDVARKRYTSLHGVLFVANRATKKANGKVCVTIKERVDTALDAYPPEATWAILSNIFGLNAQKELFSDGESEADRVRRSADQNVLGTREDNQRLSALDGQLSILGNVPDDPRSLSARLAESLATHSNGSHLR